jgi:hypothetical protein
MLKPRRRWGEAGEANVTHGVCEFITDRSRVNDTRIYCDCFRHHHSISTLRQRIVGPSIIISRKKAKQQNTLHSLSRVLVGGHRKSSYRRSSRDREEKKPNPKFWRSKNQHTQRIAHFLLLFFKFIFDTVPHYFQHTQELVYTRVLSKIFVFLLLPHHHLNVRSAKQKI